MTTGGPKKSMLRSGWCHLSCRDRWQPQLRPGWLAFSPRVVGCLPTATAAAARAALPRACSAAPRGEVAGALAHPPRRSDALRCHPQAGGRQAHDSEQGRGQGRLPDAACRGHGGFPDAGQGGLTDGEEARR
eukprot:scaffold11538_cov79-Phaeocystis_antarctica.AAC.8